MTRANTDGSRVLLERRSVISALRRACCWGGLVVSIIAAQGCMLGQLVGGMAASAEREGSHDVKAKYTGLQGKTFAVFVAADRSIQAEYPQIVAAFTQEVTRRLSESAGASGVLPADEVLKFQFQRPGWVAMNSGEIAKALEVDRLVFVELDEFTLHDPGNRYEWRGVAAAIISVIEQESHGGGEDATGAEVGGGVGSSSTPAFREAVRVKFPDNEGMSIDNMPAQTVLSELSRRFCERSAWMFYDHVERNVIKY